jgi:Protein of unknown function (DUF2794)
MGEILPFPGSSSPQIGFTRAELSRITDLYGRMVAAGLWKDYAVEFGRDHAAFWAFRRTAERPQYRIEKWPALRHKQGMWALVGEGGTVLRRGHELGPLLAPLERKLLKVVGE